MAIFGRDTNKINTNRYVGDRYLKICKEKPDFLTKPAYDAEAIAETRFLADRHQLFTIRFELQSILPLLPVSLSPRLLWGDAV